MYKQPHFLVVCGYGCNIESPLKAYLNRVANFLNHRLDIEFTILCGGETQKESFPGKSEARVMLDYLIQFNRATGYILENDSYITYDNICFASAKIRQIVKPWERPDLKSRITIFCKAQKALKVILLSRRFMADLVEDIDDIRVETYNWERFNPDRELKTTIMTWLAIKFPFLARWESENKKRLSKNH